MKTELFSNKKAIRIRINLVFMLIATSILSFIKEVNSSLIRLNELEEITVSEIPIPSFNNYSVDFWIKITNINQVTQPIILSYEYYLSYGIFTNPSATNELVISCFPEDFFLSPLDYNDNFEVNELIADNPQITDFISDSSIENTWIYTICSYSHYNREFYLTMNSVSNPIKTLQNRALYGSVKSDIYYKYFSSSKYTSVKTQNNNNNSSGNTIIYLKTVNIYNTYIPRSLDLSRIYLYDTIQVFKELLFTTDFEAINIVTHKIPYKTYNSKTDLIITSDINVVEVLNADLNNNIESSVVVLCDANSNLYYSAGSCISLGSCCANCNFCFSDNNSFSCNDGYYLNASNYKCQSACPGGNIRLPNFYSNSGICDFSCPTNTSVCSGFNNAQLNNMFNSFQCSNGFLNYDYHCYDDSTYNQSNSAFFSNCFGFPLIEKNLISTVTDEMSSGYLIEFWFRRENNIICKRKDAISFSSKQRQYVLFFEPHFIYIYENLLYYSYIENYEEAEQNNKLNTFKQYLISYESNSWNKIVIEVKRDTGIDDTNKITTNSNEKNKLITKTNYIRIFNNYYYNQIKQTTIPINSITTLPKLLKFNKSIWTNAYYKHFRIWDINYISVETIHTYNENENYSLSNYFNNAPYLKGLLLYYDFNSESKNNNYNAFSSVLNSSYDISLINQITSNSDKANNMLISNDNVLLMNFSFSFDYEKTNTGKFVLNNDDLNNNVFNDCHTGCNMCTDTSNFSCMKCDSGFFGFGNSCFLSNGFYFVSGGSSRNKSFTFNVNTSKNPFFTVSFYVKLLGVNGSIVNSSVNGGFSNCYGFVLFNDLTNSGICYMSKNNSGSGSSGISNGYLMLFHNNKEIIKYDPSEYNNFYYENDYFNSDTSESSTSNNYSYIDPYNSRLFGFWSLLTVTGTNNSVSSISSTIPGSVSLYINEFEVPYDRLNIEQSVFSNFYFSKFQIGSDILALFSNIHIYSEIIVKPYSVITGSSSSSKLIESFVLKGTTNTNCFSSGDLVSGSSSDVFCLSDYNAFEDSNKKCFNNGFESNTLYLNSTLIYYSDSSDYCLKCSDYCDSCAGSSENDCSCSSNDEFYWPVYNSTLNRTVCYSKYCKLFIYILHV